MSSQSRNKNIENPAVRPISKPFVPNTRIAANFHALLSRPMFDPVSRQRAQPLAKVAKSSKQVLRKQVLTNGEVISDIKANTGYHSQLSTEQIFILNKVLEGRNVFFTGFAGSGKSYLLMKIIKELKILNDVGVGVTASTGLAAHNIHGVSLHSLAGVGLGNNTVDQMVGFCKRNRQVFTRWKNLKILVIDEVSMIHAAYFDKLEELARRIRGNEEPFGGIQIILCGDFMQVKLFNNRKLPPPSSNAAFIFESKAWDFLKLSTFQLTKVFRQNDTTLIQILNQVRIGKLSDESCAILTKLSRTPTSFTYQKPTGLFALKKEAEIVNRNELDKIPGKEFVYTALDSLGNGSPVTEVMKKRLDDSIMADGELKLKIGAQVMIIKNLPASSLFNGQVGKIVKLETDKIYIEIGFKASKNVFLIQREDFTLAANDSSLKSVRRQFPLVLSYAMSIHKAQGQTIRHLLVDFKSIFETGQAYVALSRCVSLENLQVLNFSIDKVKVNPKIAAFHKKLRLI